MLQGLSEGHIVHYVLSAGDLAASKQHLIGSHRPAIVVNCWRDLGRDDGYSNLQVFMDGANDGGPGHILWATSRLHSDAKEPGTWHWPERE